MKTSPHLPLAGLAMLVSSHLALACTDVDCSPPLALQLEAQQCGLTGLPFLSADNDTRINLALLAQAQDKTELLKRNNQDRCSTPLTVPFSVTELNGPASTATGLMTPGLLPLALQLGIKQPLLEAASERTRGWLQGRCAMNLLDNTLPFLQALQLSELTTEQQHQFAEARIQLVGHCKAGDMPDLTTLPNDKVTAPYRDYLLGASAFYQGDFATARQHFTALTHQSRPWLKETATYLLARIELNQSQAQAFDEYGFYDPAKVDPAPLTAARQALDTYLANYPHGRYASSAQGLYRRLDWLQGQRDQLETRYQTAFAQLQIHDDAMSLFNEIDIKLLNEKTAPTDPLFALVYDLRTLRAIPDWEKRWHPLTRAELDSQQPAFAQAGKQAQWDYLHLARQYYIEHDYAAVIQAVSPPGPEDRLDLLTFSRQTLRGMALLAQQQWPQAEAHWQQLLRMQPDPTQQQLLQLALALTLERADRLDQLFAANSPVTAASLYEPLLRFSASAQLLRKQITNPTLSPELRNTALFTLLYKDLTRGHYADFLTDRASLAQVASTGPFELTPFSQKAAQQDGYQCPALTETVATLAKSGRPSAQARNCLGDFLFRQNWDLSPLGARPEASKLGGGGDRFAGQEQGRMALYLPVIADKQASARDRSYALYRAINCYARSGENHCGSEQIALNQRKQWFDTLKHQYADSSWARQQKYYW